MDQQYKTLKIRSLGDADIRINPAEGRNLSLDSSALHVFADFRNSKPLILERGTSIDDAIATMTHAHVDLKQIVGKGEHFLGVVSQDMLTGPDVLRIMEAERKPRSEMLVDDVMLKREDLHALTVNQIEASNIGDIVQTMQDVGEKFIMVVDESGTSICGVMSADQIAKTLHIPIEVVARAKTLSDIHEVLKQHVH